MADYSMGQLRQTIKPILIFVVYNPHGIRQIPQFEKRLQIASSYCSHLDDIKIYSERTFKRNAVDL